MISTRTISFVLTMSMAGLSRPADAGAVKLPGPHAVIALDVGGTAIKSGVVNSDAGVVLDRRTTTFNSNGPAAEVLGVFANAVRLHEGLVGSLAGASIGLAFPSPFDYDQGICLIEPGPQGKFSQLFQCDVRQELSDRIDTPVEKIMFINDARAAVLGEARFGAGTDFKRMIGLTLGTGLGSCFVADGAVAKSGRGVPKGEGMLYSEPYEGGIADDAFSIRGLLGRFPNRDAPLDIKTAARLAREHDFELGKAFRDFGRDLGRFLKPYTTKFKADGVVVMGGLANCFDLFGAETAAELDGPCRRGALQGSDAAFLSVAGLFHEVMRQSP